MIKTYVGFFLVVIIDKYSKNTSQIIFIELDMFFLNYIIIYYILLNIYTLLAWDHYNYIIKRFMYLAKLIS